MSCLAVSDVQPMTSCSKINFLFIIQLIDLLMCAQGDCNDNEIGSKTFPIYTCLLIVRFGDYALFSVWKNELSRRLRLF